MGLFDKFKKNKELEEPLAETESVETSTQSAESTERTPENKSKPEETDESKPEEPAEKKGFFKRLVEGLAKTRNQFTENLNQIFKGHSELDDDFYDELEEVLIMADLGLETTDKIINDLKN